MEVRQAINMKFYLNEKEIKVLNGATFSIKKDETLDNGKIELIFSDSKDPIKPMTDLKIVDDTETYNFVIMSDTVEIASKNPKWYKHTLEFVQNTKKLSKIQVRNTQFSQPAKNSLKCGCNATFLNTNITGVDYMMSFGGFVEYSYSMEISQRHKIKGAHFVINLMHFKHDSYNLYDHYYTKQDTCPELYIYFDVYKNGKYQYQKGAKYKNGDVDYVISLLGNGTYTIKNIKVSLLSDTTKYSENDLFIVNISLIADVYYYSLYDVLNTLRKQIALEEGMYEFINNPTITYSSEDAGYKVVFKNSNPYDCYIYYKTWDKNEDEPTSYTQEELNSYSTFTYGKVFIQTRLKVKAYLVKKDDANLSSDIVESYKFIPPINYEYKLYTSDYGKDKEDKYKLVKEDEIQCDVDFTSAIQFWQYIEENSLYDISEYTFNADRSTYSDDKFTIYGYQTLELTVPSIYTSLEYNSSSSGYDVKVRFMNPNTKKCKIYWYAEGSVVKDRQYLPNELGVGESYEFTLATITTDSSGKIYAKCEFEELTSDYSSSNWIYSTGGLVQPYITCSQYGNEYTYQFTIKQLEEGGTLHYRYKLLKESWSDYQTTTNESTALILSNTTTTSKIAYIEAYTTKNDKTSETSTFEQKIAPGAIIKEPKISYIIINDYTETITITNQAIQDDAVIYYKVIKNNVDPIDYSVYNGSFQIKADAGSDDKYKIFAYVYSKSAEGSSNVSTYETTLYGTLELVSPTINVRSEYVASSGGYNVYVSFINNNKIATDVYWYSTGTFAKSSQTISSLGAGETSEETLLGLATSQDDNGVIYANTKINDYRSDTISEEWAYAGPKYYTLTVNYVGVGLSETTTERVLSGTIIIPSDYIKSYSGYKYSSITPTTRFTMLSDNTITINYLVGETLDSPTFSEVSQDKDDLVFRVSNSNNDVVTLYYVINPSDVPTSASDIINATDHYLITSISANGSATETLPWASDSSLTIYGVFGSTSHSTTYDDSDVSSRTFFRRILTAPTITMQSSTLTSFTIKVYNPNATSVNASDLEGTIKSISRFSSTTFTYSWEGSSQTVNITLSKSNYTSASASETFTRPIELSAPTYTEVTNTTDRLTFTVTNPSSNDATFSYNSTVIAAGKSMTINHSWKSSESSWSISGYFYNGYDIKSDTSSATFTKPSIPTIQLVAPTISYTQTTIAGVAKYAVTITNLNSVDVTMNISGATTSTQTVSTSYTFYIDYYSLTDRTVSAYCSKDDTSTAKYISSSTTTITIPANS